MPSARGCLPCSHGSKWSSLLGSPEKQLACASPHEGVETPQSVSCPLLREALCPVSSTLDEMDVHLPDWVNHFVETFLPEIWDFSTVTITSSSPPVIGLWWLVPKEKKIPLGLGSVPSIYSLKNEPKRSKHFSDVGFLRATQRKGRGISWGRWSS